MSLPDLPSGLGHGTIDKRSTSDAVVDMAAYEALSLALSQSRKLYLGALESIEIMREYGTRTMHQAATDHAHIRQLRSETEDLKEELRLLKLAKESSG